MLLEEFLAHANCVRGHFDQFIIIYKLQRLLQGETNWRCQDDVLVSSGSTNIGQLLGLQRIHYQVIVALMYANNHAFIDFLTVAQHQLAAFLQIKQRIAKCLALSV